MTKAYLFLVFALFFGSLDLQAEGSVDFVNYPGHRLFLRSDRDQQMKVFARPGEFINVGSSHCGFTPDSKITVYRPDGTVHSVFDGSDGTTAVIFNDIQELNGPVGAAGNGYTPGVIPVLAGDEGIWSVVFSTDSFTGANFQNLLNNESWTRAANQPTNRRVITAWDVTVTDGASGPNGGAFFDGRVYANEYNSMISQNGTTTSPTFYILTPEGLQYSVDFNNTDPFGFPITSSSLGLLFHDLTPTYRSWPEEDIIRSADPTTWTEGNIYQYEPQAEDYGNIINNKLFFNLPDTTMDTIALTTDIFRNNTHTTWLYRDPFVFDISFDNFSVGGTDENGNECTVPSLQFNSGVYFKFESNLPGNVQIDLDINNDGDLDDPRDRIITGFVQAGADSIYWDGMDGQNDPIPIQDNFSFGFQFYLRGGENHILLKDVENNAGGVDFQLLSEVGAVETDEFYYNHTPVGGPTSGGTLSNPLPTNIPFTYTNKFGDKKGLDYWAYVIYGDDDGGNIGLTIPTVDDCTPNLDTDGDDVDDPEDLDDDNDGISDYREYCDNDSFDCLPGGLDPSHDEDGDLILNYRDSDDPAFDNPCVDIDANGICDRLAQVYDADDDGVPNHLDLDSDSDALSDLFEAGHGALDLDQDGVIDGDSTVFLLNGLFDDLATEPDSFSAVINYIVQDKDGDGILDPYDLDSDNDGIYDLAESGSGLEDPDNDGRIGTAPVGSFADGLAFALQGVIEDGFDKDGDGVPDYHDLDSDNDTFLDVGENNLSDPDDDGLVGIGVPQVDENGVPVEQNVAPGDPLSVSVLQDRDGDGVPNFHDLDSDNDGINDVLEYYAAVTNSDPNNDGIGGYGLTVQVDEDGIPSNNDDGTPINPGGSNPADTDGDQVPDVWDLDSDNDGINDVQEGGNADPDDDGIVSTGNPLVNADGQALEGLGGAILATSDVPNTDNDLYNDYLDLDSDNDGINDVAEGGGGADIDNNGTVGEETSETNADGQPVNTDGTVAATSNPTETDGDEIPDYIDWDSDNDGINDVIEAGFTDGNGNGTVGNGLTVTNNNGQPNNATSFTNDNDGDGVPDYLDLDSDNDGINDVEEGNSPDPDNNGFILTGIPDVNDNGQAFGTTSEPVDTDGDGIPDYLDLDSDNDGINDVVEGGNDDPDNDGIIGTGIPTVNTFGQAPGTTSDPGDTDGDGVADYRDLDSDNDGINDVAESGNDDPDNDGLVGTGLPVDINDDGQPNGATSDPTDTDGDGVADYVDLDSDNDGINDVTEAQNPDPDNDGFVGTGIPTVDVNGQTTFSDSNPVDTDGDGIPNYVDLDSDNDAINDVEEAGIDNDPDNDGMVGTGIPSVNDFGQPDGATSDPTDTDGDGYPDYLDLDSDNDAINDVVEGGNDDPDNDGIVGIGMLEVNNFGQPDGVSSFPPDNDNDGFPDYQDLDSDNDGINDVEEGGNDDPDNDGIVGTGTPVVNTNGQPDGATSVPTQTDDDGIPDYLDHDSDNDNISDVIEGGNIDPDNDGYVGTGTPTVNDNGQTNDPTSNPPDTDNDGDPDYQDVDSDGDGIVDIYECPDDNPCIDTDDDGIPDFLDPDSDGDGINDEDECETGAPCVDTDMDGNPDYVDTDTDNDGIPDEDECPGGAPCPDNDDMDGIPDWRDPFCNLTAEVAANQDSYCTGDEVIITVTTENHEAGDVLEFTWINTTTNQTLATGEGEADTDYTLNFTAAEPGQGGDIVLVLVSQDFNCTFIANAVTVSITQTPMIPTIAANDDYYCLGTNLILITEEVNDDAVSYEWYESMGINGDVLLGTTVGNAFDAGAMNGGSFFVIVNNGGCTSEPSEVLTLPVVDFEGYQIMSSTEAANPACEGEEVTLSLNGYNGEPLTWFDANDNPVGNTHPLVFAEVTAENIGEYYAIVEHPVCGDITTGTAGVFVTETPAAPTVSFNDDYFCAGNVLILTTENQDIDGVQYQWTAFEDGNEIDLGTTTVNFLEVPQPFYYEFTVTAINAGCSTASALTEVPNIETPIYSLTNSTDADAPACEGEDVVISLTDFNGETVTWFDENNNDLGNAYPLVLSGVTAVQAGSYYAVIAHPICGSITTEPTEVFINATPDTPTLTAANDALCAGSTLELITDFAAGENITYQWFADYGNGTIPVLTTEDPTLNVENATSDVSGAYSVIIFNGDCPSESSALLNVTIIDPVEEILVTNSTSAAEPACTGESATLSIEPFADATVEWFNPNGDIVGTNWEIILLNLTEADAGEYFAVVTFDICGEINSDSSPVFVQDNSVIPELATDNNGLICSGSDAEFTIINDLGINDGDVVTYAWYNGLGELVVTTDVPTFNFTDVQNGGDFSVIVSINGCLGEAGAAFLELEQTPNEVADIPETEIYFCADETLELRAVNPTQSNGMWRSLGTATVLNPNENITLIADLADGANVFEYVLSLEACGEFSVDQVTVFGPARITANDDAYDLEMNERLDNADAAENDNVENAPGFAYSVLDEPANGTVTMDENGVFTYVPNTDFSGEDSFLYQVCPDECPEDCATATVTLTVIDTSLPDDCFVPTGITPNGDGANDFLEIPCLNGGDFPNNNIMIFNRWGDKVYEKDNYENDWGGTYKGQQLPAGTYFYIFSAEPGRETLQGFFTVVY